MTLHFYPAIKRPEDMSHEELTEALKPLGNRDLWLHNHLQLLWRIVNRNWFNVNTGEDGFLLFLRHGLREWEKKE